MQTKARKIQSERFYFAAQCLTRSLWIRVFFLCNRPCKYRRGACCFVRHRPIPVFHNHARNAQVAVFSLPFQALAELPIDARQHTDNFGATGPERDCGKSTWLCHGRSSKWSIAGRSLEALLSWLMYPADPLLISKHSSTALRPGLHRRKAIGYCNIHYISG